MDKRLIATLSMLSTLGGAALVALIVHLQSESRTLGDVSSPEPAARTAVEVQESATPLAPIESSSRAVDVDESTVVELQPVHITAQPVRKAPVSVEEKALEPCSPWRDLGPSYVDEGAGIGTHRVRELC